MTGRVAKGAHGNRPGTARCAAEWRFFLCDCNRCRRSKAAGTWLTDSPPCVPPTLSRAVPAVNDRLAIRQRLMTRLPLIPSLDEGADPAVIARVERRVGLWGARCLEHLADTPAVAACNNATAAYLAGEIDRRTLRGAARPAEKRSYQGPWDAPARAAEAAAKAASTSGSRRLQAICFSEAATAPAREMAGEELLAWFDELCEVWVKTAADEGSLGLCTWLDA